MIDMDNPMYPTSHHEPPRPRRFMAVVTALALFAGGIGLGWLVGSEPPAPSELEVAAATTTTTVAPIDPPPTVTPSPSPPIAPQDLSDEPVADVAESLLPSVVQIELGQGVGSGVIFDSDGLILTAAHVVEGRVGVTVRLSTGERLTGSVLGADSLNDIAVLEVDRTGLPAAPLALDEPARVGQLAVALGSPWGLDSTVTAGIVSAVDRSLDGQSVIQTDASINPGNSGGPLADRLGRVIGINVSIFTTSGANDGVGFAVPIDRAYDIAQAIVAGESIEPAFLGVSGRDTEIGQPGALLSDIYPDTAAADAGLQVGDLIVAIDGEPVTGIQELSAMIRERRPGDTVVVDYVRNGTESQIEITLGAR